MDDRTVGILGGGQLGRMLVEAAHRLNLKVAILDAENAPAKQIDAGSMHLNGSFTDAEKVRQLAEVCNLLTVEIEHVDTAVLEEISELGIEVRQDGHTVRRKVEVQPHWRTIRTIQDKYVQKVHLSSHEIQTAISVPLESDDPTALSAIISKKIGLPCMLKSRTQAYDGRGNYPIKHLRDISSALQALHGRPLYVEKWAKFRSELAVMVVKTSDEVTQDGNDTWLAATLAYPAVETVHEDSICKLVYAPARGIRPDIALKAQTLARKAVATFWGKGIFGVEMFLLEDDTLLVNEIAPRPHNSGHYTIEACAVSQYDAHLRAALDLPFPPLPRSSDTSTLSQGLISLNTPDTYAIMLNLLGGSGPASHLAVAREAMKIPGAHLHLYGKGDARPGRKMGHVTVVGGSMAKTEMEIEPLIRAVDVIRAERSNVSKESLSGTGARDVVKPLSTPAENSAPTPAVAVTMGSDSDLPVLKAGLALLSDFEIPYEVTITSAHRTVDLMNNFGREAASRGIKVIIAAAGGAAHLPGMLAANTSLPVIGVPVKGSSLDGMDSLLSIVQMPRGVPVATVSINNSVNAALLAARILGVSDDRIRQCVVDYGLEMEKGVMQKRDTLKAKGWRSYELH